MANVDRKMNWESIFLVMAIIVSVDLLAMNTLPIAIKMYYGEETWEGLKAQPVKFTCKKIQKIPPLD